MMDALPSNDDHPAKLAVGQLYRKADLSGLAFMTTRDLQGLPDLLGQKRAEQALAMAAKISAPGFNTFAIGASGTRLSPLVRRILEAAPRSTEKLFDWVYVNDFASPHQPIALALPPNSAPRMQATLHKLTEDLKVTLPTLFESEDYQRRRSAIEASMRDKERALFSALGARAAARGIAIVRTPMGFTTAPMEKGEVVEADTLRSWPEERRRQVEQAVRDVEAELEQTLRTIPRYEKERRDAVRSLDQETARFAIGQEIEEARRALGDIPAALDHLDKVQADLSENTYLFLQQEEQGPAERRSLFLPEAWAERYDVNVLVTHADHETSPPIIEEMHPTLSNLLGRVEHVQVHGALLTNFRMIRPGALHRANGGTILIDALSLLSEPYSWPALKRVIAQRQIEIEDLAHIAGFASTASLEPMAIPFDTKVILLGERRVYYLLAALDPEFAQHFKVVADFEDDIDRSPTTEAAFVRTLGEAAREAGLRPLDRDAVVALVERAARLADDSAKISLLVEKVRDLMVEADHWAAESGDDVITALHVEHAVREQIKRSSRLEERAREMVMRDVAMIDTEGARIGQVNGLSVVALGFQAFGRPSRITARVRPGTGRIVDIEREVELGGPLHSKGVLILSGFIAGRYALDTPMSLYASLVFEQSYGGVEGDSASAAELCALLSALAEVPLRQDIAVTGSVNQHGDVQAIGGVNEKIEGFFDLCRARGLTGQQGVLIPVANIQHLMLRSDVIDACAGGRFAIWAMRTIDQALVLLTGRPAGHRTEHGYDEGTVNRAIEDRLRDYARARRRMDEPGKD